MVTRSLSVRLLPLAAGVDVAPLSNGFATTSDATRLQQLCEQVQAGTLRTFFTRWINQLPTPLSDADRDRGIWWELAMRQIEVSRTLVIDDPRRVRTVFEQLIADNLDLGRPEQVAIIFARRVTKTTPGTFATRIINRARPGHAQPAVQTLPDQDLPQGRPGTTGRDRHQRPC